jgi:hypothetical protein
LLTFRGTSFLLYSCLASKSREDVLIAGENGFDSEHAMAI